MPKYVIKEGVVEKFLTFFFKAAANKKNRIIQTDPELAKRLKKAKASEDSLARYLSRHRSDLNY